MYSGSSFPPPSGSRACAKCGSVSLRWVYTPISLFENRWFLRMRRQWLRALVCDGCGFTEFYATRERSVIPPPM
ncbi:MAG TPA: hypothetical protein VEM95_04205 [Thermoplasmata archaeon]|nr:hypothetical protein [Thermoplasmata archaeon]